MSDHAVALFHTTSAAIRSEKLLRQQGFTAALIPTPRQFSSDCGVALRFSADSMDAVRTLLESAQIVFSSIHALDGS